MKITRLKYVLFSILTLVFAIGFNKQAVFATNGTTETETEVEMATVATETRETAAPTPAKSRDNSLKTLSISPGSLSPGFLYNRTSYTATVPNSTSRINVTAVPSNNSGKVVSISGADNLSVGANTVRITVEAESGDRATYTITVTREAVAQTQPTTEETSQPPTEATTEEATVEETQETIDNSYVDLETGDGNLVDPSEEGVGEQGELIKVDMVALQDELDKSNNELAQLKNKYNLDMNGRLYIIVVLALLLFVTVIALVNVLLRNRFLKQDLAEIRR